MNGHLHQPRVSDTTGAAALPGHWWRALAERAAPRKPPLKGLDLAWDMSAGAVQRLAPRRAGLLRRARRIVADEAKMCDQPDAQLSERIDALRVRFARGRETSADLDHALAALGEVAARRLSLRPHPVQIAAALGIARNGIIELATGEGKTLAAALAATVLAWRGRGCHVITVNDYLARRDAEWMAPLYRFAGVRAAALDGDMQVDQRRAAYAADVTYLTHREAAADFLRDHLAMGASAGSVPALLDAIAGDTARGSRRLVMRGLEYAIVDEADSVLIDEAVTPLIIAAPAPDAQQAEAYTLADEVARKLKVAHHYHVEARYREVRLTRAGRAALAALCRDKPGLWQSPRRREELVVQALTARHLFVHGKHYVIQQEGERRHIVIVDEFSGRLMPDRTWRHGLHQAIEAKEGLPPQPPRETVARISFQRFFRQYRHLAGMTGTAREATTELWRVYHRPVIALPPHRPCIRAHHPPRLFDTAEAKWQAVVVEIARVHAQRRPILVGTRSVAASEHLSGLLDAHGLPHVVLNATLHEHEARIIAQAGDPGRITVATNMAGRGTDIRLGSDVLERGGLHVIATELHESARVDRQLFGRAGRQGEPGSAVAFASLEDELIQRYAPRMRGSMRLRLRIAQARAGRMAARQRAAVLRADDWLDEYLGFTAPEP